jgi:hypothetical protein
MVDPEHVRALLEIDKGKGEPPTLVITSGVVLLNLRPDLRGWIDPAKVYQVDKDGEIWPVVVDGPAP